MKTFFFLNILEALCPIGSSLTCERWFFKHWSSPTWVSGLLFAGENSSRCWLLRRCHLLILLKGWRSVCVSCWTRTNSRTLLNWTGIVSTSLSYTRRRLGSHTSLHTPHVVIRRVSKRLCFLCVQISVQMMEGCGSLYIISRIYLNRKYKAADQENQILLFWKQSSSWTHVAEFLEIQEQP